MSRKMFDWNFYKKTILSDIKKRVKNSKYAVFILEYPLTKQFSFEVWVDKIDKKFDLKFVWFDKKHNKEKTKKHMLLNQKDLNKKQFFQNVFSLDN